jgi:hypothetical protein
MIGRAEDLMVTDPRHIDLDAAIRRIDQEEAEHARRIAAAPLPAVPPRSAALLRRDALERLGLSAEDRADLAAYSVAREHGQTGPDGHAIIRGR